MTSGLNDVRLTGCKTTSLAVASPAVTRAVAVLNLLALAPDLTFGPSEISRRTGVPKSTVINLCSAMVETRLLRKTDSGYLLGPMLATLGVAFLRSVREVEEFYNVCRSRLSHVPQTVQLAVLGQGPEVLFLARHDGTEQLQLGLASGIGRSVPAHCTAAGKALLAALSIEELELRYPAEEHLVQPTNGSISTRRELDEELAAIRQRGYSTENGEIVPGIGCLGVVVSTPHRFDGLLGLSFTFRPESDPDDGAGNLAESLMGTAAVFAHRIGGALHQLGVSA